MLELCAGYGGFSLALRGIARAVCFVERDAYAAATLVARMAETRLDQAPIWDDLATFDGRPWRGRVDLISAGFPCQPFSAAGQRRGIVDDRWLWPDIERIIRDVEPGYVFLENVPGVVAHGLPEICHSLADLGFDAEWALYSAADVGATHRRQRFWLVGHRMVDAESGSTARVTRGVRATLTSIASRHLPMTPTDGPNGPPRADLNPAFVEALMGLPPGWLTASISAETDSSPNAPAPHGNCSPNAADG